jgi:methionine biosynthesis protein MetW
MEGEVHNQCSKPAVYFQQSRSEMLKYVPVGVKKVLELGCANGNFSELVKIKLGAECWGVEINKEAAQAAMKKLDRVINADVNECLADIPDKYFDCIICNDFLEHLVDPYSLLIRLKDKLTDDGVVVASFPNIRYWRNLFELVVYGDWDYQDYGILDKTHLRFFTYKSLMKMFPQLGYELLTIEPLPPCPTVTSKVIKVLNVVFLNKFKDTRYHHFACVAKPFR